jgi:hypothetical protein
MTVEFVEPEELPVPPEQVRIRDMAIKVYPDGRRLRVEFGLTPFRDHPRIELVVTDSEGDEIVEVSIVEATDPVMSLTLHMPAESVGGMYTLEGRVIYPEDEEVDRRSSQFSIPD